MLTNPARFKGKTFGNRANSCFVIHLGDPEMTLSAPEIVTDSASTMQRPPHRGRPVAMVKPNKLATNNELARDN